MSEEFLPVEWNSASGPVVGTVERKLTEPITIKSHMVAASEDHPEYLVHSDKTGARAAHRPEALTSLDRPDEVEPSSAGKEREREGEEKEEKKSGVEEDERADKEAAKGEDEKPSNKKAKLDEDPNKAAEAPQEERRQEQVAANE